MIWRPVMEKLGTLKEVQEEWSVNDLYDAHEALDVMREMAHLQHKAQESKR